MCKHKKKDKKRDKDRAKYEETDEEKRARRLAKSAAKAVKRQEDAQVAGYSNQDNPWNDPNLAESFVWGKKTDKDRARGVEELDKDGKKRKKYDMQLELEKVKRAREQREVDKEAYEEERRLLDRDREQMAFADHQKREDEFQLEQSKVRVKRRVQEGRAKPIDVLADSLALLDDGFEPSDALDTKMQDPLLVFDSLNQRELAEVRGDIMEIAQLDEPRRPFWEAMRLVCEQQLSTAQGTQASGAHAEVLKDIDAMLAGKRDHELGNLQDDILRQLQGGEADTDYYTHVLERLRLTRATLTLKQTFQQVKRRHVELLSGGAPSGGGGGGGSGGAGPSAGDEDGDREDLAAGAAGAAGAGTGAGAGAGASGRFSPPLLQDGEEVDFDGSDDDEAELRPAAAAAAAADGAPAAEAGPGRYSPSLLDGAMLQKLHLDRDTAVDEAADLRQLEARRARVRSRAMTTHQQPEGAGGSGSGAGGAGGEDAAMQAAVEAEARKGFEQGEARFSFEVPLEQKVAWWHDRYRPRKPKYFNRVHTGYEWNKYNQTHYDHDNPPPKMVQGYKFNVFFPDLIDRTKTPTYVVQPDPEGSADVCILRIKGGPPYEDIAFKVVNREWETSHKRGFKCRFERGILQLFFNFKRHRYRR